MNGEILGVKPDSRRIVDHYREPDNTRCANGVGNPTSIGFSTWSTDRTTVPRCVLRGLLLCQKPDNVTLAIGNLIPCGRLGWKVVLNPIGKTRPKRKPGRVLAGLPLKVGLGEGNVTGHRVRGGLDKRTSR